MTRWVLVLVLLAGCRGCSDDAPSSSRDAAIPRIELAESGEVRTFSDATRYDCVGVEPDPMSGPCPETHAPGDDLIVLSDELTEITGEHAPETSKLWAPAGRALAKAETVDPASLVPAERIALQNAALHLSRVAKTLEPAMSARANTLMKKLAVPSPSLPTPDLQPWLGPSSDWTPRHVNVIPFVHEQFFSTTRVLRIVRTPTLRANFSKLVAIDPAGKPYVTEVIGSLEIRRGLVNAASVCVALLDPSRLRCSKLGGLRAMKLAELPQTPFLRHDDSVAKCNSCHMEEDAVVGLKLIDGFEPDHDQKVLDEPSKTR